MITKISFLVVFFKQVVFHQGGVLEQICPGKGYIDMSTVDPETSVKISEVGFD